MIKPIDDSELVSLGPTSRNQWRVSASHVDLRRAAVPPDPVTVPTGKRTLRLDLARSAIVIIDMQNDFCHAAGWLAQIGVDVSQARAPIVPLARLLPNLRQRAVPVIWLNWGNRADKLNLSPALHHVYNPDGRGIGLGDPLPEHGERVLQLDSWAAAIVDELRPDLSDIQVAKYRMSGFPDTPLDSILRNLGVNTLLFAGVNLDQCVACTLQDANFLGYDCLLLEDCCGTTSPDFCRAATLYNVQQCFGFVVHSERLLEAMQS